MTLATAHPAKFTEIVGKACGATPELPERLAVAMRKEKQSILIEPTDDALQAYLLGHHDSGS